MTRVFVDVETNGTKSWRHGIVQIGLAYRTGTTINILEHLVSPPDRTWEEPDASQALAVNGQDRAAGPGAFTRDARCLSRFAGGLLAAVRALFFHLFLPYCSAVPHNKRWLLVWVADAQAFDVYVHLSDGHAQGALHVEFDGVHDAVGHRGDARAVFDDDVHVNDDLLVLDAHVYAVAGVTLKNVGHFFG